MWSDGGVACASVEKKLWGVTMKMYKGRASLLARIHVAFTLAQTLELLVDESVWVGAPLGTTGEHLLASPSRRFLCWFGFFMWIGGVLGMGVHVRVV